MGIPSASYSITMRVHLGADPLGIGRITTAVGEAAGTVVAVDIVESHPDLLVVDLTCNAVDARHADAITQAVGVIEGADAEAEGQNPLCGDEVSIYVAFGEDGETIDDVKFSGRGCAISQAATSMLVDMAKGRTASELAEMPKDELLEEIGIPLTPIRLKCALLGLGVLKVALHRAKGTPLPQEWAGLDELDLR